MTAQPADTAQSSLPPARGVLVAIDGPSAVGKSTTVTALARRLRDVGVPTLRTAQPSGSDIGRLARARVHVETSGLALACLYAADRYQQLDTEIRPHLTSGHVVILDRYLASALVMQRLDGVTSDFLQVLNNHVDQPDLAVILTADPDVIAGRLAERGAHNRYQRQTGGSAREVALFAEAATRLRQSGLHVLVLDNTRTPPDAVAAAIYERIERTRLDRRRDW